MAFGPFKSWPADCFGHLAEISHFEQFKFDFHRVQRVQGACNCVLSDCLSSCYPHAAQINDESADRGGGAGGGAGKRSC